MAALSNPKHERFYVYVVRVDGRTRYVGKGTGNRFRTHLTHSHNKALASEVRAATAHGESVRVRIVSGGLTERAALRLERRMIANWSDRLLNISLGNGTALDNVATACRANLRLIKSEADIRSEGAWKGTSVEDRLALRLDLIACLTGIEVLARAA
ncbi:hypothetical protein ACFPIF_11640 [Brevundimonas faecalis]|uniref:hypothetical protein n=1 Tax=Brevundimonas faecalis TaxID=947378 RepID=UPI00361E2971